MILSRTAPFALLAALARPATLASPATAQPAAGLDRPLLVHGNYCGPGNNAPLPPIDALAAACARHDACTPSGGLPSRACNVRLEREASAVARDPRQTDELRAMAGLVSASITLIPSDDLIRPAAHRSVVTLPAAPTIERPSDAED